MSEENPIAEKTAWPVNPIELYKSAAGEWGYLIIYSDNTFQFSVSERPTEDEITKRWGYYFNLKP